MQKIYNSNICSIEGCNGKRAARGWCYKHYKRYKLYGDVNALFKLKGGSTGICVAIDCSKSKHAKNLCNYHLGLLNRYGNIYANPPLRMIWEDKSKTEKALFHLAKARSKKKNIEFSLTEADVKIPERCPVLDIPITLGTGHQTDSSPSVDRIDITGGYTPDNVIVVSYLANRIKTNATIDQLQRVTAFYSNRKEASNGRSQ